MFRSLPNIRTLFVSWFPEKFDPDHLDIGYIEQKLELGAGLSVCSTNGSECLGHLFENSYFIVIFAIWQC